MSAKFISIEGGEGTGKSTQLGLLAEWLRAQKIDVITTREPGGTSGAEAIRELLLSGMQDRWTARTEALLFAAARADHVAKLIRPALDDDKWVICDRFVDSSRAYQGAHDGLTDEDIMTLHKIGSNGLVPDMTIILHLPLEKALDRAIVRDKAGLDRIGARNLAYHRQVAAAFEDFARKDSARFRIVDAAGTADAVHSRVQNAVETLTS